MNITPKGERTFHFINHVLLAVLAMMALYPFIYVLMASVSSGDAVRMGKVLLLPKEANIEAYKRVLMQKGLWIAYGNTIFYTVAGTLVNMLFTVTGAYALSKKRLIGKKFFNLMIAFTMWFNAGMIPFYLNLRDLNLTDKRLGILIAFACQAFNVILLRNYFEAVPSSLEEAAKIDGANELQVLWKIYLPLSKPALTTVGLFYAINRWNGYFWAMILLTDEKKVPLQVLLKKLIIQMDITEEMLGALNTTVYSIETIVYATIVISIIPIVLVYPYIQKYFTKGVMLGGVKE
ncbi:MAG: carbohydrate ABC transporter permease [Bacillota bacterium]